PRLALRRSTLPDYRRTGVTRVQQAVVKPLILRLMADNRRTDSTPNDGLNTVPPAQHQRLRERRKTGCATARPTATRAARIVAASDSHRRVEPSISVNRNVTTPDGRTPPDTRTGCHIEPSSTRQSRLTFETLETRVLRDRVQFSS